MSAPTQDRPRATSSGPVGVATAMERVAVTLACVWMAGLLVAFLWRVGFPLELEWMEGGVLLQARRMLAGQPIYGPPSTEYVPFLYTPGQGVVLAALGLVFPLSLPLARAVSIAATLATWWGIAVIVRDEAPREANTRRATLAPSLVAVGLYAASYVFTHRWMDLARADAPMLALLVWGAWCLRWSGERPRRALLAGVLLAAAFWTKQTAFVVIFGLGLGALALLPWASLLITAAVLAVTCLGGMALLDARTDGWAWRWIYEAHQAHPFNEVRFWRKSGWMVLHAAPFAAALVVGLAIRSVGRRASTWRVTSLWSAALASSALASALGYSTLWAETNAFLPLAAFGAIWIGIALAGGFETTKDATSGDSMTDDARATRTRREPPLRAPAWTHALAAGQLAYALLLETNAHPIQQRGLAGLSASVRLVDPWRTLPTREERARAAELVARLQSLRGPVLALSRPWWSVLAGGEGHVGSMGLNDVDAEERAALERELSAQVRRGAWPVVITEGEPPRWLAAQLRRGYRVELELRGRERVRPKTGWMSEPGMPVPWRGTQRVWLRELASGAQGQPPRGSGVYAPRP